MRHRVKSNRVNRNYAHLSMMLRNLATSVVLYEKVKTTQAKSKLLKPFIEKLIVDAQEASIVTNYRNLNSVLLDKNASKKLIEELVTRYKDKKAGFVRVTKLGFRAGDSAPMVQVELV